MKPRMNATGHPSKPDTSEFSPLFDTNPKGTSQPDISHLNPSTSPELVAVLKSLAEATASLASTLAKTEQVGFHQKETSIDDDLIRFRDARL
ncbi:hypothetical protein SCOR_32995 [Sulfidibacter corallicola]|uniref:Uncharacterized protein n=1 Tax=Sulfidibacter corallicola TaxID=2818388 RepID=A0A8A4TL79_SULCO|nr:hypothetical protein [Sulfidibacter corallicola]QTD49641.1 hypothetical protein J3U87_29005 [Sulfidibacter corallicola]